MVDDNGMLGSVGWPLLLMKHLRQLPLTSIRSPFEVLLSIDAGLQLEMVPNPCPPLSFNSGECIPYSNSSSIDGRALRFYSIPNRRSYLSIGGGSDSGMGRHAFRSIRNSPLFPISGG